MTETVSMLTHAEARSIAKEAYIYGFPLVDNYRLHYVDFVDLRTEPLIVTVPAVEKDRGSSVQFVDAYTFTYAFVESGATRSSAGRYLLTGPDWKVESVEGVADVIRSETDIGRLIFPTPLYATEPLSVFLGRPAPVGAPKIEFIAPLTIEQQRKSPEFFGVLDFVLRFCPTLDSERDIRATFARLGVGTGTFDESKLSPDVRQAVEEGIADAWAAFEEFERTELDTKRRHSADLFGTRAFLNTDYLARMAGAILGRQP